MSDFLDALNHLIETGHTLQFSRWRVDAKSKWSSMAQISGPTGSRTAYGVDAADAFGAIITMIARDRLS